MIEQLQFRGLLISIISQGLDEAKLKCSTASFELQYYQLHLLSRMKNFYMSHDNHSEMGAATGADCI